MKYQGWNMLWHLAEEEETNNLKTLLRVGFNVNLTEVIIHQRLFSKATMEVNHDGQSVLMRCLETFGKRANQEVAMLLYAAGETLENYN